MNDLKQCIRCKEFKSKAEFNRYKRMKDGLDSTCKKCTKIKRKTYNDSDRGKETNKKYRANNSDKIKVRSKKWREENAESAKSKIKDCTLIRKYGFSKAQLDELFKKQGSKCSICGSPDPLSKIGWSVDHDHTTNRVRGILCQACNCTLGMARENIHRLQRCLAYLRFHKHLIHYEDGKLWLGIPQGGLQRA